MAYRIADRLVLRHFPSSLAQRVRAPVLWLARRVYGARIQARSVEELAAGSHGQRPSGRMPGWAAREIRELARFEPALRDLTGRSARVGEYFIPWNTVHVGHAYALARRQLKPTYACMILTGSAALAGVDAWLANAPRPAVVIDVDADPALRTLCAAQDVDYLSLAHEGLNDHERAALLTRLVLQLHPRQLRHANDTFLDFCLQRHGLAMQAVSQVQPLPGADREADAAGSFRTGTGSGRDPESRS